MATTTEHLRKEHRDAHDRLKRFNRRELKKWKNEPWKHYFHRMKLHRKRRKNLRRIDENFEGRLKQAIKRKEDRQEKKERQKNKLNPKGGDIVTFDGKPCVEWIAYWLKRARENGWNGVLVSGYRTPEYSQQLCYQICGAPSCPGRCAGTSSNHTKKGYLQGAVDVSDYITAERVMYQIGSPLKNNLPSDLVHLSASGY